MLYLSNLPGFENLAGLNEGSNFSKSPSSFNLINRGSDFALLGHHSVFFQLFAENFELLAPSFELFTQTFVVFTQAFQLFGQSSEL
jgi:hypothetical protein